MNISDVVRKAYITFPLLQIRFAPCTRQQPPCFVPRWDVSYTSAARQLRGAAACRASPWSRRASHAGACHPQPSSVWSCVLLNHGEGFRCMLRYLLTVWNSCGKAAFKSAITGAGGKGLRGSWLHCKAGCCSYFHGVPRWVELPVFPNTSVCFPTHVLQSQN